jgi:LytS/YehU family sensor histidine kinase
MIWGIVSSTIYTGSVVILISKTWELIFRFKFDNYYEIAIVSLIVVWLVTLQMHAREFLLEWKRSGVDIERLEKERVIAQYENLKSQMNPHFLFNGLNALTNLIYEDPAKATKFVKQLTDVYQYVLDTNEKDLVPLEDELNLLESYVFLQQVRFGQHLKIENQLQNMSSLVVPLALQSLIENAIKHNRVSLENPLTIKLYEEQDYLVVENLVNRKVSVEKSKGIGINSLKKRYKVLTEKQVLVVETENKFIVKLPIVSSDIE